MSESRFVPFQSIECFECPELKSVLEGFDADQSNSVALTGSLKEKFVSELGAVRAKERKKLAPPDRYTQQIREETGVQDYAPVRSYSRAEAEAQGLIAPAAAFESLEGRDLPECEDSVAYRKKHNIPDASVAQPKLPMPEADEETRQKWRKDVEALSSVTDVGLPLGFALEAPHPLPVIEAQPIPAEDA